MDKEAKIIINGVPLTVGQAMVVRVALNNFWHFLETEGLGDDEIGLGITSGYMDRINEITIISKTRQLIESQG